MPAAKKQRAEEEIVFLAIRVPKSMKRDLQQVALDRETTVQAIVRDAVRAELARESRKAPRTKHR